MNAHKRIQWLHKYIVNMRYPNASRLAERFGISHRQAQRDVTALREEYGAPLAYSADRRGFYYTEEFSLPAYTKDESEFDYVDAVTEGFAEKSEAMQLQIPYTAVLRIPDKLTRLTLGRFIVGEESRGNYVCEFHNVEQFLSVLITLRSDFKIVEPMWIRERLVKLAENITRIELI